MKLDKEAKRKTISDLKKYPDWIVAISCPNLGGEPVSLGGYWGKYFVNDETRRSLIEESLVYDEEIKRKIFAIESVMDRMEIGSMTREIIRLRYFYVGNSPESIQRKLAISKRLYFMLQGQALQSFAVALRYAK